jgi:hypothetical protein
VVENGFSVDVGEIEALAGKYVEVADEVRDHVSWKFAVDIERWPAEDRLRDAVDVYQRGLRAVVERLCGNAEDMGVSLRETAEHYRETGDAAARHLLIAWEVPSAGGDRLGRAAR